MINRNVLHRAFNTWTNTVIAIIMGISVSMNRPWLLGVMSQAFQSFWHSSSASFPLHPSVHPCFLSKLSLRWSVHSQPTVQLSPSLSLWCSPADWSQLCPQNLILSLSLCFCQCLHPFFFYSWTVIVINGSRGVSVGRTAFSLELPAINQACLLSPGVHKHAHKNRTSFFSAGGSLSLGA